VPLVIFKQDRQPTLAIIPSNIEPDQSYYCLTLEDRDKINKYKIYLFDELLKYEPATFWIC